MAFTGRPRGGRLLARGLLALAVLLGVLAMHGLSTPAPMADHAMRAGVPATGTGPAAMPVDSMSCTQHPCVAVLRAVSPVPSPGLVSGALPAVEPPASPVTSVVQTVSRAPPQRVSLTRLCVCRT